jgi:2-methylcitrate dehydratase PrpD
MSTTMAGRLTARLAQRASELRFADIPQDVAQRARHALLDWFGVALAGSREHATAILLEVLADAPGENAPGHDALADAPGEKAPGHDALRDDGSCEDGSGAAGGHARAVPVVGLERRLPPLAAALVNGTSAHALDFDDVNMTCITHITAPVAAAVLTLAEREDVEGESLLVAFVAGYETAGDVGAAVGPAPYMRGFHATGTIGALGAAAACARLLELDAERTAIALSLAATQAAGLKSNLGTMSKPLHAGKAAQSGLLAAQLAGRGFTANPDAIEAEQGLAAAMGGERDAAAYVGAPAGWHLRNNLFKYHAACYLAHPVIDAIAAARVDPLAVCRVAVHVSELERGACVIPEPASALEVKFSVAHLAAMALLGRDTSSICDADATEPALIAMRRRVQLAHDGEPEHPTVDIELTDGSIVRAAHDSSEPERDLAVQRAKLEAKFTTLAVPVLGQQRTRELARSICSLDARVGAREVMALAVPR